MSTARKKRATRERELDRLHRRLNSPRPDLPILRSAERPKPEPTPIPSSVPIPFAATPPEPRPPAVAPTDIPTPPNSALIPQHSALPEWTRLLPLPNGLPPDFRSWLIRHIETTFLPSLHDTNAQYIAARIALAIAHQHLAAAREPEQISPVWLRYEAMADRQFRTAIRDWQKHQKDAPVQHPVTSQAPAPAPHPSGITPHAHTPQSPPIPPNTTFARTNSTTPIPSSTEPILTIPNRLPSNSPIVSPPPDPRLT